MADRLCSSWRHTSATHHIHEIPVAAALLWTCSLFLACWLRDASIGTARNANLEKLWGVNDAGTTRRCTGPRRSMWLHNRACVSNRFWDAFWRFRRRLALDWLGCLKYPSGLWHVLGPISGHLSPVFAGSKGTPCSLHGGLHNHLHAFTHTLMTLEVQEKLVNPATFAQKTSTGLTSGPD